MTRAKLPNGMDEIQRLIGVVESKQKEKMVEVRFSIRESAAQSCKRIARDYQMTIQDVVKAFIDAFVLNNSSALAIIDEASRKMQKPDQRKAIKLSADALAEIYAASRGVIINDDDKYEDDDDF